MPKKKTTFGLRLRSRGGLSVKKQWTRITLEKRKKHKCPSCTSKAVRRASVGIWYCTKCGHKFAGGAYIPSTKTGQASTRIRA